MRIMVTDGSVERDVLVCATEATTLGELVASALGGEPCGAGPVFVDGVETDPFAVAAATRIGTGSVVSTAPPARVVDRPAVELRVLVGPGAGRALGLPAGRHVVGAGEDVDVALRAPGVRGRRAVLWVDADGNAGIGDPDGTRRRVLHPASIVRIGSVALSVARVDRRRAAMAEMPGRRGTVSFNRPPRRTVVHRSAALSYPELPTPPARRGQFSVIALVVPLLFGLVMAVLVHPRMALFALLGPAMMVGGRLEDRRRTRRHGRAIAEALAAGVDTLSRQLSAASARELVRRHAAFPGVAELAQWPGRSTRMWERRPHHGDFMRLVAGYGRPAWCPPLAEPDDATPAEFAAVVSRHATLPTTAVPLDLGPGQVLGVAGARGPVLDAVRGLMAQAAVLHGPADLRIAVVTDHPADWRWAKWLPHTVVAGGSDRRLLAVDDEDRSRLAAMLAGAPTSTGAPPSTTLLVVDIDDLEQPHCTALRQLLGGRGSPLSGLVVAPSTDRLPSTCTAVLESTPTQSRLHLAMDIPQDLAPARAGAEVASTVARRLARFDDPERVDEGAELPGNASLVALLGGLPDAAEVRRRWSAAGTNPGLPATVGVTEAGRLVVDLVADGPHGLVAGTTGSGKSELLRTVVGSLAVAVDPDHLTFVLIDYKGGSAFDVCAELPHTVGVVTDLDDDLSERALRCLEAELRHRERHLRDAGADDLSAYLAMDLPEPVPRMLIVVDEFAALAQDLPDFMDALVDIAARGRSLGVHLLLATQRPAGVIRDNIRANTNLRIALSVQERADSTDVLGDPRAAAIGRSRPGRGFARLGPGELVAFQTALVTGHSGADADGRRPVATEFVFGMDQPAPVRSPAHTGSDGPTDLERLVDVVSTAAREGGFATPRRPWPDPLPTFLALVDLDRGDPPGPWSVPIGMLDEPELQRRRTMWWDAAGGSLAMYGVTGAGTTTALATIAVALAERTSPEDLHLYVFDFDDGTLAPLSELPHVGAVVAAGERERQVRLLRRLSSELDLRRSRAASRGPGVTGSSPRIVVMVDNFAGFTAAYDAGADTPLRDAMHRIVSEGAGVGIVTVVTGSRQSAIPLTLAGAIPGKLVFRMADPLAAASLGLRSIPADCPDGRAIHAATGRTMQIAVPHAAGVAAAVAPLVGPTPAGGPGPVNELPSVVKTDEVAASLDVGGDDWLLPVGIGDADLTVVGLQLAPGDHALVVGEPRSGRSSLLCSLAEMVGGSSCGVTVTAFAPRPSPLRSAAPVDALVTDIAHLDDVAGEIGRSGQRHLLLLDDVDAWDAPPSMVALVASSPPEVHVVAAGRRDLKSQFNHWAKELCRSRIGLWLKPSPGLDGDLWSTPMPRRVPPGVAAGRGYLVCGGTVELVQAAIP